MDFLVLLWAKLPIQKRTYVGRKYRAKTKGKKIERKKRVKKNIFLEKNNNKNQSFIILFQNFPRAFLEARSFT